jgi:Flp pilus assembly protein TadD
MELKWRLAHVRGYLGLGMIEDASAELDQVPPDMTRKTEVLVLRALVLQEQAKWPTLVSVASELVLRQPMEPGWWVAWAYAARRSQSLAAAEAILLEAERTHPQEASIQFNLGCYACLRGDLTEARRRVDQAIALERSFREAAATDPDLALLRDGGA